MPSTISDQPRPESNRETTIVLVKAVPRPSKTYRETVCCAGVTPAGEWRRLYPVRFRQLTAGQQFNRWQRVSYGWHRPRDDSRAESRRIAEDSIQPGSVIPDRERLNLLLPLLRASAAEAASRSESLAIVEPRSLRLRFRLKDAATVEAERQAFRAAARQESLLDRDVSDFEPCPYAVAVPFVDQDGVPHAPQCGDWETTATFFKLRRGGYSDDVIRDHLRHEFTEARPGRRVFLALGTVKRRPKQWLLLGILRVKVPPGHAQKQLGFGL